MNQPYVSHVVGKALMDLSGFHKNITTIISEREFLLERLKSITAIQTIHHTDANFVLFQIPSAEKIYKIMADKGIVCRYRWVYD